MSISEETRTVLLALHAYAPHFCSNPNFPEAQGWCEYAADRLENYLALIEVVEHINDLTNPKTWDMAEGSLRCELWEETQKALKDLA